MVGWCHRLNGHKFEQAPGDGEGWGSLVCCSPRGHRESDRTEWLKNSFNKQRWRTFKIFFSKSLNSLPLTWISDAHCIWKNMVMEAAERELVKIHTQCGSREDMESAATSGAKKPLSNDVHNSTTHNLHLLGHMVNGESRTGHVNPMSLWWTLFPTVLSFWMVLQVACYIFICPPPFGKVYVTVATRDFTAITYLWVSAAIINHT